MFVCLFVCLSQDHNKVLELLNKQLSSVASSPSSAHSERDRLQSLAVSIAERYKQHGHRASRQLSQTFFLLLDIMQFFDHYHSKRIDVAYDVSENSRDVVCTETVMAGLQYDKTCECS